jgi:hypothetical protein
MMKRARANGGLVAMPSKADPLCLLFVCHDPYRTMMRAS